MTQRYFVGTSGWTYPEWRGVFYPQNLPQADWLAFYADRFKTVEINGTFYHLPTAKAVQEWHDKTPNDFSFAVKMSRFITHMKHLKHDEELVDGLHKFFTVLQPLQEKLAVALVQLPASLHRDDERLRVFIEALLSTGKAHGVASRFAIEFREASWFCDATFDLLRQHNIASVINSAPKTIAADRTVTADFLYLRFHGDAALYKSNYSDAALKDWAQFMRKISSKGAFAYFNNTMHAHAINNAKTLLAQLEVE